MPRVSGAQATLDLVHAARLGSWVRALSWDPHGERLAAACADGPVSLLTVGEGEAEPVHHHAGGALIVAYSAAGALASGGQDGRLIIAGAERRLGTGWVEHVAWRPDGAGLAAAHGRQVSFWTAGGELAGTSRELPATVDCIAWDPRGITLAAGAYGGVRLLRANDARETDRLDWTGSILTLAFSPDGKHLAHGNQDASVHFWDLRRKRELEMTGYPLKIRELAWSPDGRWLATGGSDVATVWSMAGRGPAGTRPRELEHHDGRITALSFQPRERLLASAAQDGCIALWDVDHDDLPLATVALDDPVTCLSWARDGRRLAAGTSDGTLAVFDVLSELADCR